MKTKKNILLIITGLAVCATTLWFSTLTEGSDKTYEINPSITVPAYKSDAARAIDAYERLMQRYMDMTEKKLDIISADIQRMNKKIDTANARLMNLGKRISNIEKAVNGQKAGDPNIPNPIKCRRKCTIKSHVEKVEKSSKEANGY